MTATEPPAESPAETIRRAPSAERSHAYRMGGAGRERIVDALAKQLHHNESLHLHTLPGDEGDACKYCYLRAGRAVGVLAPVAEPDLITTAEQLRALPVGTVLLDNSRTPNPWLIRDDRGSSPVKYMQTSGNMNIYWLDEPVDMALLLSYGPFRVLHTPEVA